MTSPLNQTSIGQLVKSRRKQAGLTQDTAALLCGVTKKTLIRVEKGEDVYISTLFKILDGLGVRLVEPDKGDVAADGWY
ncbi:helix-turn-helix domain-containing protein [Shewanella sp. 3B26]|uniref:Helix-turn-helix domain-containing protein n=1 Tax=Shewanella zhuhaiensis TaxID=2919576 RepID=A0AAJ1EYX2_9GAMM|nr:helix-turn-helix transcriptional regulator [Shewanella zhuhaiensis]MCH4292897.1 helix-turn-helix domain-containing protein [Shewanella zhuhaiensis]